VLLTQYVTSTVLTPAFNLIMCLRDSVLAVQFVQKPGESATWTINAVTGEMDFSSFRLPDSPGLIGIPSSSVAKLRPF
jgi:hypothetical protein